MEESSSNSFKQKQTQCINFYKKYKKYVFDKSYYKVENNEYNPSKNAQNQFKSKLAIIKSVIQKITEVLWNLLKIIIITKIYFLFLDISTKINVIFVKLDYFQ